MLCFSATARAVEEELAAKAKAAAAATLTALLGSNEQPSALARNLPSLRARLADLAKQDGAYQVQEYINEGWQPLPVHTMHAAAASCKLRYVASASLPENFVGLLPAPTRDVISAESDPALRETLQDLAINQSFRRDVFCHGRDPLPPIELSEAFSGLRARVLDAPAQKNYSFNCSFGQITVNAELYAAVEASIADGVGTFAALRDRHNLSLGALAQLLCLLLHGGRLGLDRGEAGAAAIETCRSVSQHLLALQRGGRPYSFIPVASIGSAVPLSLPEALLEHALRSQPDADPLPALASGLERLGRRLATEPSDALAAWQRRQPVLEALGVILYPRASRN